MPHVIHVFFTLLSTTVAAIALSGIGISLTMIYTTFKRDDIATDAMYSMAAGLLVPVFFLCVCTSACIYGLIRSLRILFGKNNPTNSDYL